MITTDITETFCSFELCKLIATIADVASEHFYVLKKQKYFKEKELVNVNDHLDETCCPNHDVPDKDQLRAITHDVAITWLREKHDIHIFFTPYTQRNKVMYEGRIYQKPFHNSGELTESKEATILYAVKSLIK